MTLSGMVCVVDEGTKLWALVVTLSNNRDTMIHIGLETSTQDVMKRITSVASTMLLTLGVHV